MKINWLAICTLCCTPVAFAQGGRNNIQQQKRFGDSTCLPAYLAQYDVNGDGVIGEEERQVMEQARDQIRQKLQADWDTDGDGKISDQERDQARVRLRDMIIECRTARFWEAEADRRATRSSPMRSSSCCPAWPKDCRKTRSGGRNL